MKQGRQDLRSLVVGLAVLLLACQSASPAEPRASGDLPAPSRAGPTTLTVAVAGETPSLATRLVSIGPYGTVYGPLLNSPLISFDHGVPQPLLAAEQPSRTTGSWIVNADGTMQTTWKIRPNARWHDGNPVVPADFLFAFQVYTNPGVPLTTRLPESYIDRVEPAGDKAFTIFWKQLYPWANELKLGQMQPLPAHLMESAYNSKDPLAFANDPFWASTDYIGNGPYKLVQWDRGTQLIYKAFDDYFMGRPKIDQVIFRVIPDENTLVANILGNQVDTTAGSTLGLRAGLTIREQWRSGEGVVKFAPTRWDYAEVQHDPDRNRTPGLLDVRVRRAIVHGTDRDALAEAGSGGAYPVVADIPLVPDDRLYGEWSRTVRKYPFDPRQALALLEEAGWTKRGDTLVDRSGEPFSMEMRSLPGSSFTELQMKVMAADLRKLGMQISEEIIPPARAGDLEYRVTFPGLNLTQNPAVLPNILELFRSEVCTSVERRYAGSNRGCFSNPEYDRLVAIAGSAMDPADRDRGALAAGRLMAESLGVLGLDYALETVAVRGTLTNAGPSEVAGGGSTTNIHEWYWAA